MKRTKVFDNIIFRVLDEKVVNNGYGYCQRYEVELNYNGKTYTAHFTDSVYAYQNGGELNFKNVMYCLLSNVDSYNSCRDIDDFQSEFGFKNAKASELLRAYNGCKETAEAFNEIFTEEELEELHEEIKS